MVNNRIVSACLIILAALTLVGCGPTLVSAAAEPAEEVVENTALVQADADEPVQITGTIELSNDFIIDVYFVENFVLLEDLHGFVNRDFD